MKRRVTTHDIAREAGVSRTTVSHVLNKQPDVALNPKTRERVLATARKLGYVPNSAAQMLVTGRSRTVGLVLSRPDLISVDAFVPSMIYGLNEVCRVRGYRLLMDSIHDPSDPDSYLELAKSKRIDGLIVINPRKNDAALRKVIESKFPLVVFGSSGHPQENSIGTKDGQASCGATHHLISLGTSANRSHQLRASRLSSGAQPVRRVSPRPENRQNPFRQKAFCGRRFHGRERLPGDETDPRIECRSDGLVCWKRYAWRSARWWLCVRPGFPSRKISRSLGTTTFLRLSLPALP